MILSLSGKNDFELKAELQRIVSAARAELGDIGIERFDAQETSADAIIQAVQALPFLVPKKLVVVQQAQANTELMERIQELVDRTADAVDVVLVGPVFDKRKSAFKLLKKLTQLKEFAEPKPHDLPSWLAREAKARGLQLSTTDASYMVDRIGANQLILARELEKLGLYDAAVSRENIDMLTERTPHSSIFAMLDAAFTGDHAKALALYREQRQQRVEPQYIIAMLAWQLAAVAQAAYAEPMNEPALIAAGQSPFTARKSLTLAKRLRKADVKRMLNDLVALDAHIKTSADADAALELYLLKL